MEQPHQGAAPGFLGPGGLRGSLGCVVLREYSSAGVCQAPEAQARVLM